MARLEAQPPRNGLTGLDTPVLLGDVGGTNARFARLDHPGAEPGPVLVLPTAEDGPQATVARAIATLGGPPPRSAVLALAGPVIDGVVRLTNVGWTVDGRALGRRFGWSATLLVNDFAALAAALPDLEARPGALVPIGPDRPPGPGPRVILGPGTGLGTAALVPAGPGFVIVTTEAGHGSTGPSDAEDAALWPFLPLRDGRVMPEALVSGPGLLRLAAGLAAQAGGTSPYADPAAIVAAARAGEPLAGAAVAQLLKQLGRFAGDMALVFGANGSIAITGGVAGHLADRLNDGILRRAFESRPPYSAALALIPTRSVAVPEPAFVGLAALARDPARFGFGGPPNLLRA